MGTLWGKVAAGLVLVSLMSGALPVLAADQEAKPIVQGSTFRCESSGTGKCGFLLYSSNCKEGEVRNGHAVLVCTHEYLTSFMLKVGESKQLTDLPPNFKQCVVSPEAEPKFPDCAR